MSARLLSSGHGSSPRKVGSSPSSPGAPRTISVGTCLSWRNGKGADAKSSSSRARRRRRRHGIAAPVASATMSRRRLRSAATDASRSAEEVLLEHGVARDRDAHQPDDQLAVVGGLSPARPLLREADLGEERPHRGHGAEAVEPVPQPLEERGVRRPVARDVAERGDRVHLRIPVRMLEREVAHPTAVRRDRAVDGERKDEPADGGRGENRPPHRLRGQSSATDTRARSGESLLRPGGR